MEPTPLGSPSCFPPPALNCSDLPTRLAPPPWVLNKPGTSLPEEGGPGQQRREALAFVSMGVGERSMTITSSSLSSGTPPPEEAGALPGFMSCPGVSKLDPRGGLLASPMPQFPSSYSGLIKEGNISQSPTIGRTALVLQQLS